MSGLYQNESGRNRSGLYQSKKDRHIYYLNQLKRSSLHQNQKVKHKSGLHQCKTSSRLSSLLRLRKCRTKSGFHYKNTKYKNRHRADWYQNKKYRHWTGFTRPRKVDIVPVCSRIINVGKGPVQTRYKMVDMHLLFRSVKKVDMGSLFFLDSMTLGRHGFSLQLSQNDRRQLSLYPIPNPQSISVCILCKLLVQYVHVISSFFCQK